MPHVTVQGAAIHYEVSGAEGRIAMLLLHGSGGSAETWPRSAKELPGAAVYALDMPGHGQSEGTPPDSVEGYADLVEGVVAALGLERVVVCGHSLGGAIALTLALRQPAWLAGIVPVGSGAKLRVNPMVLGALEQDFGAAMGMMGQVVFGPGADAEAVATLRRVSEESGAAVVLQDFRACDRFDVMDRIAEIRVPTLAIVGDHDGLTPAKYGQFLADAIDGAEIHVIEGAGHMMAMERPEAFTAALAGFMERF